MSVRLNVDYMDLEPLFTKLQETLPNDEKLTRNDVKRFEATFYRLAEINNGGWISVKDRLPEEKHDVLCYFPSNMAVGFLQDGEWCINSGGNWYTEVVPEAGDELPTHWMPLPDPPQEVAEDA